MLADASKFGMEAAVSFATLDDAEIITAGDVPDEYAHLSNLVRV